MLRNSNSQRRVLIALTLAACLGSLGHPAPSQAQDQDPGEFQFLVDVINPLRKPLCVGETTEYLVRVLEKGKIKQNEPMENASFTLGPGTTVSAEVTDSAIADVTSARTMLINSPSPTQLRPAIVAFTVKAKKAGSTTIKFSAVISAYGLTIQTFPFADVPVTVQNCKFKLSAVQQAVVAGGGNFNIVAMIDEAEMKADESGHFAGTTTVNWAGAASQVGICSVTINVAATSPAELKGDLNDNGQLAVAITYQSPGTSTTAVCAGVSRTEPTPLNGVPLQFSVPHSGGVVSLSEGIEYMGAPMPGSAIVIVIPEEDQAAAFNSSIHLAGGDGFSNLFSALSAVY